MQKQDRKAAVLAWKERKPDAGIFAVSCAASGRRWIGTTTGLAAVRNRLWFTLGQGGAPNPTMQADWRQHGDASFDFAVLERLEAETPALLRDLLEERLAQWLRQGDALPA